MKHILLIVLLVGVQWLIKPACSQSITPERLGFEHHSLESHEHGTINYYLSSDMDENQKPLLVYLDGSGPYPLFQQLQEGYLGSTVVIDFQSLMKEYRILLISKPGVPFADSVASDENGFPVYPAPEAYQRKLSLDWRAGAASQVINAMVSSGEIDAGKIVVLGFSEGAQVAPFLAKMNPNVTHLMLFGGNGLNQLFDPMIAARMKAATGQWSEKEAQAVIDSLYLVYQDIYRHPGSTKRTWWGHTYQRWASFTLQDPGEVLLGLDIPIYLANGSLDENSVLSADYIRLEFIKEGKNNLTYRTYPGYDHQFNELVFEDNVFKEAIPRLKEVMTDAFDWLQSHHSY